MESTNDKNSIALNENNNIENKPPRTLKKTMSITELRKLEQGKLNTNTSDNNINDYFNQKLNTTEDFFSSLINKKDSDYYNNKENLTKKVLNRTHKFKLPPKQNNKNVKNTKNNLDPLDFNYDSDLFKFD